MKRRSFMQVLGACAAVIAVPLKLKAKPEFKPDYTNDWLHQFHESKLALEISYTYSQVVAPGQQIVPGNDFDGDIITYVMHTKFNKQGAIMATMSRYPVLASDTHPVYVCVSTPNDKVKRTKFTKDMRQYDIPERVMDHILFHIGLADHQLFGFNEACKVDWLDNSVHSRMVRRKLYIKPSETYAGNTFPNAHFFIHDVKHRKA